MLKTAAYPSISDRVISATGMVVILGCSLAYSIYYSYFAKLHIQLPFLNFPVFIGEFLLVVCLVLTVVRASVKKIKGSHRHYILFFYTVWVLIKALLGYIAWGPLAFRNAALFYYPLLLVAGYVLYERDLFTQAVLHVLLSLWTLLILQPFWIQNYLILPMIFLRDFQLSYFLLALILTHKINNRWMRYGWRGLILTVFPYKELFVGSRSNFLGLISAFLYLTITTIYIMGRDKRKWAIFFVGLSLLSFLTMSTLFVSKINLKSLVQFHQLWKDYNKGKNRIAQEIHHFSPQVLSPRLYNPDASGKLPSNIKVYIHTIIDGLIKTVASSKNTDGVQQEQIVSGVNHIEKEIEDAFDRAFKMIAASGFEPNKTEEILNVSKIEIEDILRHAFGPALLTVPHFEEMLAQSSEQIVHKLKVLSTNMSQKPLKMEIMRSGILFRLFVWRDMVKEMVQQKAVLGINFGKPQRSQSIEILDLAREEWQKDGWITPHNSFLHMIYRGGVVGLMMVISIFWSVFYLSKKFLLAHSMTGIFLTAIIVYWLVISIFLVFMELPYTAIPFWCLFGMVLRYSEGLTNYVQSH